jgi:hypothetical protein
MTEGANESGDIPNLVTIPLQTPLTITGWVGLYDDAQLTQLSDVIVSQTGSSLTMYSDPLGTLNLNTLGPNLRKEQELLLGNDISQWYGKAAGSIIAKSDVDVPEPATMLLVLTGCAGIYGCGRRRR